MDFLRYFSKETLIPMAIAIGVFLVILIVCLIITRKRNEQAMDKVINYFKDKFSSDMDKMIKLADEGKTKELGDYIEGITEEIKSELNDNKSKSRV